MSNISSWKIAQSFGAAAILLRSIVASSRYSLYATRGEPVNNRTLKIPVASITNEDVDLFCRLTAQGRCLRLTPHFVILNSRKLKIFHLYRRRYTKAPHKYPTNARLRDFQECDG